MFLQGDWVNKWHEYAVLDGRRRNSNNTAAKFPLKSTRSVNETEELCVLAV
jgi:hypothetical protein